MMPKISEKVKNFYNKTSFPDYNLDRFDTKEDLKLSMWNFAGIIDRSIPKNAKIIDIGTGQLSAYL